MLLVRWEPDYLGRFEPSLDPSWMMILSRAFAGHWQFGKDVLFTFGPYGFLFSYFYDPHTYPLMIGIQLACTTILLIGLWQLARRLIRSPLVAACWVMGIVGATALFVENFYATCAAVLLADCFFVRRQRLSGIAWALCAVMGLMVLTKFIFWVVAIAVV